MLGAFVDQEYSINIVARQHHFKRQFVSVSFVTDRTSRFDAFSLIAQVILGHTIRTMHIAPKLFFPKSDIYLALFDL